MDSAVTIYYIDKNEKVLSKDWLLIFNNDKIDDVYKVPSGTDHIKLRYRNEYHNDYNTDDDDDNEEEKQPNDK